MQNNSDSEPSLITFKIANLLHKLSIDEARYVSLLVKEQQMQEESDMEFCTQE